MPTTRSPRIRARVVVTLIIGAVAIGLTACGSSSDQPSEGATVTITHTHGETAISGVPQRIVALGNQWLDAALALGVTPVGYLDTIELSTKTHPGWEPAALERSKSLSNNNMVESVAALNPDLILTDAILSDDKTYSALSHLAPTVPALSKEIVNPWQGQVTALGKILHKSDEATKIVAGVNDRIDGLAQKYPGLKGKTFASTWLYTPSQLMVLTDPNDGSSRLFAQLGLTIPTTLASLPSNGGRVALSPERVDELQVDLLLAATAPGLDGTYQQLPGYRDLPAVRRGAVAQLNTQEISGFNQPTALSLPYLLGKLEPALANAAK